MNTFPCEPSDPWPSAFPTLAKLRLGEADFAALATQGVVHTESRRGKTVFKLRFRRDRRQHVRYIGGDARIAQAVQAELALLQHRQRQPRRLLQVVQAARRNLRTSKQQLAPLLHDRGYYFHGTSIRRRRRSQSSSTIEL